MPSSESAACTVLACMYNSVRGHVQYNAIAPGSHSLLFWPLPLLPKRRFLAVTIHQIIHVCTVEVI